MNALQSTLDSMTEAAARMRGAVTRLDELEFALHRMILEHETTTSESDGQWPKLKRGCVHCTQGVTPDTHNTGPCAYHAARKVLGLPL